MDHGWTKKERKKTKGVGYRVAAQLKIGASLIIANRFQVYDFVHVWTFCNRLQSLV